METILQIKALHQYFERGTVNENHVLKGLNLEIKQGDFITIIGGNGAGKSTLLNSIAGTLPIEEGQMFLGNKDITKQNVVKRSKQISRVFQDPRMGTAVRLTVEENLAIAMKRGSRRGFTPSVKKSDRQFFQEQLATLNLGLEDRLQTEIGLLSGGQRQAITLLMAAIVKPDLLLLDEHTAALDPKTSAVVMDLTEKIIAEQGLTAFMVTHNMADAITYGNRLIMLHQGQIVVDLAQTEKENLTVADLLELFHKNSGSAVQDDTLLLG
ncbi:ABC transporter ATP-binding protein [Vagococcus salmoninarum]|uniref:ABC transporter ATP-binding protein n=1 Tax=Vagococcus salmoninarum TaxID=2739 RepID=UPI003F95F620